MLYSSIIVTACNGEVEIRYTLELVFGLDQEKFSIRLVEVAQ